MVLPQLRELHLGGSFNQELKVVRKPISERRLKYFKCFLVANPFITMGFPVENGLESSKKA